MDATLDTSSSRYWLPAELIEIIIREAWSMLMAVSERTSLFFSLCRVNKMWLEIFARIALQHVHLPCPLTGEDYLRLVRERLPQEAHDTLALQPSTAVNNLCQSLTFHVEHGVHSKSALHDGASILLHSPNDPAAASISSTLYMASTLNYLPNLRRISIEYLNWGFEDIQEQGRLLVVPEQAAHLEIRFAFSDNLADLARTLRGKYYRRWCADGEMPGVRRLSVFGAPTAFVGEILWMCPNVEVVEFDCVDSLAQLISLPDSVRELHMYLDGSDLKALDLASALEGTSGLEFTRSSDLKIVVHSESVDDTAWADSTRICRDYGIQILHSQQ